MAGASSALVDVDQAGLETNTALATLPVNNLISNELANFAKKVVKNDNVMDIYLQTTPGTIRVGGGSFGAQDINALSMATDLQQFIKDTFTRLDPLIDLDFRFITTKTNSDLDFYVDSDIEVGGSGTTLGIALSNSTSSRNWWELALNGPALQNQADYLRYATIHEFGHAMGLEHPFDNGDGDYYGSTNSGASAYPEDSVMSYRSPLGGSWPTWYSSNDILALQKVWGVEASAAADNPNRTLIFNSASKAADLVLNWYPITQLSTQAQDISALAYVNIQTSGQSGTILINKVVQASDSGDEIHAKQIDFSAVERAGSLINGGKGSDEINGYAGSDIIDGGDGNDLIRAGNGRDIISGGAGADELWGGFGWNTFRSEKDNSSDLIVIKSDQFLVNWLYGKAGNNPSAEKCDVIEGLDSSDKLRIVGVATEALSFNANASAHGLSGIGIYANGFLEALYIGTNLSTSQLSQITSGDASEAAMNNAISSYGIW
ncbi:M10 family metallopeptidase [Synechococcus lacustris C3-12m-Tous]|uniref:M10 family metallopeptidase n=1 Tax=Synechococcus lacustris TaxID=2116544 RepID=UPI0020CF4AEE|nr:M10 family metallopeptidase [Synechococcus lacustris]MCP9924793.1 M10 family metallopeptidase [Synechococcus lacustris C3-12m-Tous]